MGRVSEERKLFAVEEELDEVLYLFGSFFLLFELEWVMLCEGGTPAKLATLLVV